MKHREHGDDHVNHHTHEAIVELIRVPTRFEADTLVAKLHANGIDAIKAPAAGGGWMPHIERVAGHIVRVFENDLGRARALIATD